MAPTIFKEGSFRFFFFSREESRIHVHVSHPDGEAKFWIEPVIALATSTGLSTQQIKAAESLVNAHLKEINHAWHTHFRS
jgi:ribosomal protein L16/L10AE